MTSPATPSGRRRAAALAVGAGVLAATPAGAGMPVYTLSDLAASRVDSLGFFLVLILALAAVIRWLWNGLRRDLERLPTLSYPGSLALVVLWGLLFHLVLTMISGARELMTPGAWEKSGTTYRLAATADPETTSRAQLERLGAELVAYAASHGNRFPPHDFVPEIAAETWSLPDRSGERFVYVSGRTSEGPPAAVAYEPRDLGDGRWVLFTDGTIARVREDGMEAALAPESPLAPDPR